MCPAKYQVACELGAIACRDGSTRVVTSPIVNSYQFMKTTKYIIEI